MVSGHAGLKSLLSAPDAVHTVAIVDLAQMLAWEDSCGILKKRTKGLCCWVRWFFCPGETIEQYGELGVSPEVIFEQHKRSFNMDSGAKKMV